MNQFSYPCLKHTLGPDDPGKRMNFFFQQCASLDIPFPDAKAEFSWYQKNDTSLHLPYPEFEDYKNMAAGSCQACFHECIGTAKSIGNSCRCCRYSRQFFSKNKDNEGFLLFYLLMTGDHDFFAERKLKDTHFHTHYQFYDPSGVRPTVVVPFFATIYSVLKKFPKADDMNAFQDRMNALAQKISCGSFKDQNLSLYSQEAATSVRKYFTWMYKKNMDFSSEALDEACSLLKKRYFYTPEPFPDTIGMNTLFNTESKKKPRNSEGFSFSTEKKGTSMPQVAAGGISISLNQLKERFGISGSATNSAGSELPEATAMDAGQKPTNTNTPSPKDGCEKFADPAKGDLPSSDAVFSENADCISEKKKESIRESNPSNSCKTTASIDNKLAASGEGVQPVASQTEDTLVEDDIDVDMMAEIFEQPKKKEQRPDSVSPTCCSNSTESMVAPSANDQQPDVLTADNGEKCYSEDGTDTFYLFHFDGRLRLDSDLERDFGGFQLLNATPLTMYSVYEGIIHRRWIAVEGAVINEQKGIVLFGDMPFFYAFVPENLITDYLLYLLFEFDGLTVVTQNYPLMVSYLIRHDIQGHVHLESLTALYHSYCLDSKSLYYTNELSALCDNALHNWGSDNLDLLSNYHVYWTRLTELVCEENRNRLSRRFHSYEYMIGSGLFIDDISRIERQNLVRQDYYNSDALYVPFLRMQRGTIIHIAFDLNKDPDAKLSEKIDDSYVTALILAYIKNCSPVEKYHLRLLDYHEEYIIFYTHIVRNDLILALEDFLTIHITGRLEKYGYLPAHISYSLIGTTGIRNESNHATNKFPNQAVNI